MGSKGSKPRKAQHSQHLPKVGTSTEDERLMHEEHQAIADVMGVGNAGPWLKYTVIGIGVLVLVGAVVSLIFVLIFV
jgi:hypothetical protein